MNFKTTLFLVVLLLVLGGVYIFAPWEQGDDGVAGDQPSVRESMYFRGSQSADATLTKFEIKKSDGDSIVCERMDEDSWLLKSPIEATADRYQVESVAKTIWNLKSQTSFTSDSPDAISAADAGLEPPIAVITVTPKVGSPLVLEVGKGVMLSKATYVRLAGESTIHTVGHEFKALLNLSSESFRARDVMSFVLGDVSRLIVRHGETIYEMAEDNTGDWRLSEPMSSLAVKDEVREYLVRLSGIEALEFISEKSGSLNMGFDVPALSVEVGGTGFIQKLIIGSAADLEGNKYFAKMADSPSVFLLSRDDVARVTPSLSKLRDARLTGLDAALINKIVLTHGNESEAFVVRDGKWVGTGDFQKLDAREILKLLRAIAELRATEFIDTPTDLASFGLDSPRAVVSVWAIDRDTPVTIEIGDPVGDKRMVYARIQGENVVALIGIQSAAIMASSPLVFCSRVVFDLNPNLITEIEIIHEGQRRKIQKQDEDWHLIEPVGAPINIGRLWLLVSNLSAMVADSVVARDDDEVFGLSTPGATIRMKGAGDEGFEYTLLIGYVAGHTYARRSDDSVIFELNTTLRDDLKAELIEPKVFSFAASDIVEYQYVVNKRNLHLKREGGVWGVTEYPELALKTDRLDELMKAAVGLEAQWFLSYDKADMDLLGEKQNSDTIAEITIKRESGEVATVSIVSVDRPGVVLACWHEGKKTFWMDEVTARLLVRGLDYYIQVVNEPTK